MQFVNRNEDGRVSGCPERRVGLRGRKSLGPEQAGRGGTLPREVARRMFGGRATDLPSNANPTGRNLPLSASPLFTQEINFEVLASKQR